MFWNQVWSFIRLTRPLFLVGGFMLYALGVLLAVRDGWSISIPRLLMGQAMVTLIQLMTHYSNEYYDRAGDRLNMHRTWFNGGSGILPLNHLSPRVALLSTTLAAGAAVGMIIVIADWYLPIVSIVGLFSLLLSWSYSGPPLRLAGSGWGELSASLIVAMTVPLVGYMLQANGSLNPDLFLICLPLLLIHFAMLIAFQIPDIPADQSVGKRTLAVRLGLGRVVRLHNFSIFAAFCVILILSLTRWPGSQYTSWALPLAVWQAVSVRHLATSLHKRGRHAGQPVESFFTLTLGALGLFAGTTALWMAGLLF